MSIPCGRGSSEGLSGRFGRHERTFSVEVQRVGTGTFFERCVFYASGLFHDELVAAEDYGLLKPVYLIAIMEESLPHEDEKLWNDGRFISEYAFTEKNTGELAPPTINIIFAELGRFRKDARECASEQDWLFFWFKHGWEYDSLPSNMDSRPFITGLADACAIAGFTPEKKQYYRALMKDQRDYNSIINQKFREGMEEGEIKGKAEGLAEGMMKGKAEGLAEGKAESARNIALEMLDRGMDPKLVAEITKLDISEIEKIDKEQANLNKNIPFKVKFHGNYLWQIYYAENTDKYFMIVPTEDTDYSTFFYLLKKQIENKKTGKIFVPVS